MIGPTTAYRKVRLRRCMSRLLDELQSEFMDEFLLLLLNAMRLVLAVDAAYHRNIEYKGETFNATYVFRDASGAVEVTAKFEPVRIGFIKRQRLRVRRGAASSSDVEVMFVNGRALWEFLMSPDPDVFDFILNNKLQTRGNLNYLMKFGYMANRLKEQPRLSAAAT